MLDELDAKRLLSAMAANQVVLFVGAGFSIACKDGHGRPLPLSKELAEAVWAWAGLRGDYDGSDLPVVYQAALQCGKELRSLRDLLESHLVAADIPGFYDVIPRVFWYRLYGTNADDVIEKVFRRATTRVDLEIVAAPAESYRNRDQFLRRLQYVKLHGSLPGDPRGLTFGTINLARRANSQDDWWHHFIRDYTFNPVVFIGSELNEPLMWQAIEARGAKGSNPESRPTSYLVSPSLSPARAALLPGLNITHVAASAQEFCEWLSDVFSFPERLAVISTVSPELAEDLAAFGSSRLLADALPSFLSAFERVHVSHPSGSHSVRGFLRGGAPTWADLAGDGDAPLAVNDELTKYVEDGLAQQSAPCVVALLGEGGSGKSTILRRVGLTLTQRGQVVYLADGADRPDHNAVRLALRAFGRKVCLFIDNAALLGPSLAELVDAVSTVPFPPVIVAASRYIPFEQRLRESLPRPSYRELEVPRLSDPDIESLLITLEKHNQLGTLLSKTEDERRYEFKHRAQKQLLVALREATEGRGFDEIMRSEFQELTDRETRVLFLCGALASAALVDLSRQQIFDCSESAPSEALRILRRDLVGMLDENERGLVVARHPVIADYLLERVAGKEEVMEAYRRVLLMLARDIYPGAGRRSRAWRLYVRLTNHNTVFDRFGEDIDHARGIYELTADAFANDGHFWLQYANLEVDFGWAERARPLIANAEGLLGTTDLVLNTRAHILLREALTVRSYEEACALRADAEEILSAQMDRARHDDEYPFHVYLTHMLSWIRAWSPDGDTKKRDLERLLGIADETCTVFGRNKKLKGVRDAIFREYLKLAESRGQ